MALRLPPEIEQRLEALARKTGRTKSYYAREAILEKIEDLEDRYMAEERHRTDSGERIPLATLMERYATDLGEPD